MAREAIPVRAHPYAGARNDSLDGQMFEGREREVGRSSQMFLSRNLVKAGALLSKAVGGSVHLGKLSDTSSARDSKSSIPWSIQNTQSREVSAQRLG